MAVRQMSRVQMGEYMRLIVPGVTVRWRTANGSLADCLVTEADASLGYFGGIVDGRRMTMLPIEYVARIETSDDVIEIPPP